ncbi:MBL fold metallo-hydrolase RNA specificity domain-containing protein [Paenibacillus allorhizosphaerae]|uniref:Ribonuclease J n=1 Tax=Paenibacillus allorhizosphaerae TaxID=2849866 RepID=A0ABM8VB62_9BACL|nr:MBL fold metallo-hydrolase RNA specificity domain-containing protein [Paenibacillus allorhizosphaerae]CAG7616797.1 Ribonuclease J [Paenibacillus allorhizosphaerae]
MSSDRLTFFNGTVGTGVQVLYGNGGTGLLFDFGIPHRGLIDAFNVATFDPIRLFPRRGARQLLLGGMAPPIMELYDEAQIDQPLKRSVQQLWGNKSFPEYDSLSVYISHVHQDHIAILPYAREGLKVYMSRDTHSLYRGIVASGEYGDTKAAIVPLDHLTKVDFGGFIMHMIEMDHDATGAAGILIESSEFKIAFTGDWTRNGYHPERIDRFIELCRTKEVDVLITESTHPKPGPERATEPDVVKKYINIVKEAEGMVYFQSLPRNVERMTNCIHEAVTAGRHVALDYGLAVLWSETLRSGIKALEGHPVFDVMDTVRIVEATVPDGMPLPFGAITVEEMIRRKSELVYFLTYPSLPMLIELETMGDRSARSHYIVGNSPMNPDQQVYLEKYVAQFGMALHKIGTSGHASAAALSDLIKRISPKAVIPMHSGNPRALDTAGVPVYYPERGETIAVRELIASAAKQS